METNKENKIVITDRSRLELIGVSDIIKYDNENVVFRSGEAELSIVGCDLNVRKFDIDNKTACITGMFNGLSYYERNTKSGRSLLKSLFK